MRRYSNVTAGPLGERMIKFVETYYPLVSQIYVTSGTDGNHGTGSHHYGQTYNGSPTAAIDFGGYDDPEPNDKDQRDMGLFADWLFEKFWDLTVELIHTQPHNDHYTYVKNQKKVGAYAAADHVNHIHWATSAALMDQIEARAKSWTAAPGLGDTGGGVLFGWDASDFDWSRGARPSTVVNAANEGIRFFTHKITEATHTVHRHAGEMARAAVSAGIPFVGFYVVPRTPGAAIDAQVNFAISQADAQFPEWRTFGGFFWQVDTERWPYDTVSPTYGAQMCDLLMSKTGKQAVHYAPKWAYGNSIPGQHPLWASSYGSNPATGFKNAYAQGGGNNHAGWAAYSGRVPAILQYGSKTVIGGQPTCDANAFRGTVSAFANLIGATTTQGDNDMTPEQASQLNTLFQALIPDPPVRTQGAWTYTRPDGRTVPINPLYNAIDSVVEKVEKIPTSTVTLSDEQLVKLADLLAAKMPKALTKEEVRTLVREELNKTKLAS